MRTNPTPTSASKSHAATHAWHPQMRTPALAEVRRPPPNRTAAPSPETSRRWRRFLCGFPLRRPRGHIPFRAPPARPARSPLARQGGHQSLVKFTGRNNPRCSPPAHCKRVLAEKKKCSHHHEMKTNPQNYCAPPTTSLLPPSHKIKTPQYPCLHEVKYINQ